MYRKAGATVAWGLPHYSVRSTSHLHCSARSTTLLECHQNFFLIIFQHKQSSCDWKSWQPTPRIRAVELEGFSTWGVGVAENFNNSDSRQTFCSPIVTVCATNVRKHLTLQFKQLDVSTTEQMIMTIQKGCSALTCIPTFRGHSRSAASLGLITQPTLSECNYSGLVSLKFPFAHSGWHYRCSVTLVTPQWMRSSHGNSSVVT